ncbi:Uncharacterised protein [Klebsiella variicola]|nr:Uncharacterised protein [Klebsiella variicola]
MFKNKDKTFIVPASKEALANSHKLTVNNYFTGEPGQAFEKQPKKLKRITSKEDVLGH